MTALELIARLRDKGIRIKAVDGELELDAPTGALDESLRDQIIAQKSDLLRLLSWSRRSSRSATSPLLSVSRNQPLPLSWAQQRLWFLDQLEPDSSAYNISWTVRLRGELHSDALNAALTKLVLRHESLRTVFPAEDGVPRQRILADVDLKIVEEDISGATEERFRARLSELAARTFNLATGPLMRVSLLRQGQDEHILLVVIHHIVSDGASMRVLFKELAALYDADLSGAAAELPALDVQYADFAVWQRNWLDGTELERQTAYWRNALAGLPPLLEMPWDRPRSAAMRYRGASVLRVLPEGLASNLRAIGREQGATLYMTMLAAFYVLLMRYSGREDLVVGTPMGGRSRTQLEGLIGFFINTVVLRADLSGEPDFSELLGRVRDVALEAHAHQDLPFEKLVEELQPERELSYSPVFQVMFDLQEEPRWKLPVRNLEVVPEVVFSSRTSSFDLTLSIRQAEHGLDAMFEYDTDLFDEATVERMARHYQTLLESIVLDSRQSIAALSLVEPAEQRKLVTQWNTAAANYADDATIATAFEAIAARYPTAIAVQAGAEQISYADFNARANRLAHQLQARGTGVDVPVALCAKRRPESFLAIMAVLKAGGCVVPLDPVYPVARLQSMLSDSGAQLLLVHPDDQDWANLLDAQGVEVLLLDEAAFDSEERPARNPKSPAGPDSLAYLMYTSGSTGKPKGAELRHRGFVNYIQQLGWKTEISPQDRVLQFASLSFDIAIEESLSAFLHGATLVLRDSAMRMSLEEFASGCARNNISWMSLPTAWWHELCDGLARGEMTLPASLRTVIIGGEKAELESLRKWQQFVSNVRLLNTYGPTEASIVAAWYELTHLDAETTADIPIGYPVPNVRVWVMDDHLQPLPVGVPGEVYIGGVGIARGYRNPSAANRLRFFEHKFVDGTRQRLYRTGDRARYLADGRLAFMGRADEQVKVRGHRVEPADIEAALGSLPGVGRCAVILDGSGATARLVAYLTGDGLEARLPDMRAELAHLLPEYMLPSNYVLLHSLPFTENGKLDRRALPIPERSSDTSLDYVAPEGPTELALAAIWGDVLGVARIGRHDDFFALGGHSLIATRVMARVRGQLHSAIPLRALFDSPTVAALARLIDTAGTQQQESAIQPRSVDEDMPPLSWSQQRLWVLDNLEPNNSAYNLYSAVRVRGAIDESALQAAVNGVVARHEVLRTRFVEHQGEVVQLVMPELHVPLEVELLDDMATETVEARLLELTARPFDLQSGDLIRVMHLRSRQGIPAQSVLLVLMHHIVSDGWSMGRLFEELAALYTAERSGRDARLPPLPIQYADYAIWQREQLESGVAEQQADYWRQQLAGAPPLLRLPTDRERPPRQSYKGAWVSTVIEPALQTELNALAAERGCTLFMLTLSIFKVLVARHTGQFDLVVGTPVAGRTRKELEGLIGFFLNTLVLRTSLDGNPTFNEVLTRVRATTLDAYEHQDLPFEKLLELLQPERSTAYTPIVQVMFNLHNERSGRLQLDDVYTESFSLDRATAKFDLSVALAESEAGLRIGFEYSSDLFAEKTVEQWLAAYELLLRAAVANPDALIASVPLAAPPAYPVIEQQGYRSFDPQAYSGLVERFAQVVAEQGDRQAVQTHDVQWTYAELDGYANQVGQSLLATGRLEAGGRVALLLGHDATMLAGLLGVLKAGAAYVALDAAGPAARNRSIVEDADVSLVLCDAGLIDQAEGLLDDSSCIVVLPNAAEFLAADTSPALAPLAVAPDALAYILFTSGSTGRPKGVLQTQQNVLQHIATYSEVLRISPSDRLSLYPAYGFDAAVMDIYGALLNGACLCPVDLKSATADRVPAGLSILHATPTVFRFLIDDQAGDDSGFVAVRAVVLGGEAAQRGDFELFRQRFPDSAVFINGFGPSESTLAAQFIADHTTQLPDGQVPIGRAVAHCDLLLLDEHGNEAGIRGEIAIRSACLSPGYLGLPELTQEKFSSDPNNPELRIYRTGDSGRLLSNGELLFEGRLDAQLKVRGVRVEPGEIEALVTAESGVQQCAVAYVAERLLVYYTGNADAAELRESLLRVLPTYMLPDVMIPIDGLPLKPNGKVDHAALAAIALPDVEQGATVAPRNPAERWLAALWERLLELDGRSVGIHDDFFRMGGHSLLAMRVTSRIREHFGASLSLRDFFATPTVAGLVEKLKQVQVDDEGVRLQRRENPSAPAPLSWAQERLWFLDQLEPDSAAYNLHWAARLQGNLNATALEGAVQDLVARHESLRTAFIEHGGVPVAVVASNLNIKLQVDALPGAGQERVRLRLLELVRRPFDLRKAPLLRAHLLRTADDEAVLLLVMHHIVTDGWSMDILFSDLGQFYRSRLAGVPAALPQLSVQYADFATWQRDWLNGPALDRQVAYWSQQLDTAPPLLELPLDHARPPVQRYRGAWETLQFSVAQLDAIRQLAASEGVTVYMVLLSVFKALLMRHTGREDILVGTPVAGRRHSELEALVGFFLNTLVLRTQVGFDLSFRALLQRVRQTTLDAYDHQDLPFEKLLEVLRPARSTAHTPLIQVTFNLHNEPSGGLQLADLDVAAFNIDRGTSKFDLSAVAIESKRGLNVGFEYNTDLFDAVTVQHMLQDFAQLLSGVVTQPDLSVAQVALGRYGRQPRPLNRFQTFESTEIEQSIPQRFARIASENPDRTAVVCGEQNFSYRALDQRSGDIAWALRNANVQPGSRVGLLLGHHAATPATLLATLRAGCVYIPLDPHVPVARLQKLLTDGAVSAIVADNEYAELLGDIVAGMVTPPTTVNLRDVAAQADPFADVTGSPDDLAYILFTSGSTGTPKGVMQTHRNVLAHVRVYTNALHIAAADRLTQFSAFGFDAAVMDIFGALLNGACLMPVDLRSEAYPGELLDRVALEGVTLLHATPTVFRYLMRTKVCRHDLGKVRAVVLGGEEAQRSDFELFKKQFAPPTLFVNGMGPSESTMALQFFADHSTRLPGGVVPVGDPVDGTEIRVLDESGQNAGVVGELLIRSRHVSPGYWNQPELTNSRFSPDEEFAGYTAYRSGDRVRRLPNGQLVFQGRIDNQLKVLGNRVEPGEIEAELLKQAGIERAAVVLRNPDGASHVGQLTAYIVGEFEAKSLRRSLRAQLPEHMIPAAYVRMDDLPLTRNGKLDRSALPAPDRAQDEPGDDFVAARTDAEQQMTRIWEDVLGIERISVHDDFFELGGHSLLAAQLASRVMEAMQVALPIRRIFDSPTIATLSEHVDTLQWALNQDDRE